MYIYACSMPVCRYIYVFICVGRVTYCGLISMYHLRILLYSLSHVIMCRFAYETGAKSLYANLPGNLSLATNLRAKGENYPSSLGPRTQTLHRNHLHSAIMKTASSSTGNTTLCEGEIHYDANIGKLWHFPSYCELSHWQFDLAARRAGVGSTHIDSPAVNVDEQISQRSADHPGANLDINVLTHQHWDAIISMIEAYVDQLDGILHLEPTHLVQHMSYMARFDNNMALSVHCGSIDSESGITCTNIPLISSEKNNSISMQIWNDVKKAIEPMGGVRLVVINMSAVDMYDDWRVGSIHIDKLWGHVLDISSEYVLIIGACSGAPTEITLTSCSLSSSPTMSSSHDDTCIELEGISACTDSIYTDKEIGVDGGVSCRTNIRYMQFTVVEDVCREKGSDLGASLYRNVNMFDDRASDSSSNWLERRFGVVRRIKGSGGNNLVTRRITRRSPT